jgi:hypothetical protein
MARLIVLVVGFAVLCGTGTARAGRRFGGDDTGFVPPSRSVARCEDMVAKLLRRDAACLDGCTFRAAGRAFFQGKPFDDEQCEARCGTAFISRATGLLARNICPPCITAVSPAVIVMINEQASNAGTGLVACAGTVPLGGDDDGFVAPDAATGRCELAVGRNVSKLDGALIRCHVNAANVALRGGAFDDEGCEAEAERRYDAANATLTGCPLCLDAVRMGTQLRASHDAANGLIYCASPSGGFLD